MPRRERSSSVEVEPYETQFVPKENDEETLWDVIEITAERGAKYKVKWAGTDPATGKPWEQSWVPKEDCTDDLILEWKRKQARKKKGAADRRKSGTRTSIASSSKVTTRSTSPSATTPTRRTRHSTNKAPASTASRSTITSGSRAKASTLREISSSPRKRRRTSANEEPDANALGAPRPAKKRKVEVEVVEQTSQESPSSHQAVNRTKPSKRVSRRAEESTDDEQADEEHAVSHEVVRNGKGVSSKAAGKRRLEGDEAEQESATDGGARGHVPLSKVGPPRNAKRRLHSENHSTPPRDPSLEQRPTGTPQVGGHRNPSLAGKHSAQSRSHNNSSRPSKPPAERPSTGSRAQAQPNRAAHPKRDVHSGRDESDSDNGRTAVSALWQVSNVPRPTSTPLSPRSRQQLMQEEEENTQEAAGLVSVPSVNSPIHSAHEEAGPEPGPSVPPLRHGRSSGDDTFSRDGIVPETQSTSAPHVLDEPPYDPVQHDLIPQNPPSTPIRSGSGELNPPGSAPSVVSKMKKRKRTKLRPIGSITPPDFRPYVPSTQLDDIEEFSSPERDGRGRRRDADPPTQDTIEDPDFSQDIDRYVDWNGGVQHEELPAPPRTRGLELSLGPDLTPPEDAVARPMSGQLLLKRTNDLDAQPTLSPEIPLLTQPPPTSTTQRADADSQSLDHSLLNNQIAELTAQLEDRDGKLSELESQIEGYQERIAQLERENGKDRASFEAELRALREAADEKSEQISLLESQLVELQLQLAQLTDNENQRAQLESQVRELTESLEERDEQISQLEGALVELQTEIETVQAENEKLAESAQLQQERARDAPSEAAEAQRAAAVERLAALEQELTTVREQLSSAREEASARAEQLETARQEWERRLKDAEEDRDLCKKLYSEASTHAQRLARENTELEERAQRAEGQVKEGLAMVRGTFAQQVKAAQAESERWRGVCKVLKDAAERTDDEVRRRAALEPALQEENARLRVDVQTARREVEKLKTYITQLSVIRRETQENDDDEDEDEDVDFVPDPDENGSTSSSSSSESSSSSGEPGVSSISIRDAPSPRLSPGDGDEESFVCQYVLGSRVCHARFPSAQDVIDHADHVHYGEGELVKLKI